MHEGVVRHRERAVGRLTLNVCVLVLMLLLTTQLLMQPQDDMVKLQGLHQLDDLGAMSCHYRVASTRSAAGLSEANLPRASGTQRLPRLIGVVLAIDFMCTGAPAPEAKAVKLGIDDVVL